MKSKLLILLIAVLAAMLCFAACTTPEIPDVETEAEVTITSLEVVADSVPTQVDIDTIPDFSGIKVKVNYSDGTSKTVGYNDVTVSQLDTTVAGTKNVTVTYEGKTVKFEVVVVDPDATAYVTSIKVVPGSFAEVYHLNQTPDYSKLQVEATYSTGKTKVISTEEYTYTTIDTATAGEQTLVVTYKANTQITASVKVNVYAIKSISVITGTVLNKINVGDTLDTSAIEVLVEYMDGYSESIAANQLTVGTIDTTTYGDKELIVTYKGIQIKYTVKVVGPVSITVNKGSYPEKVKVGATYAAPEITGYLTYSDDTKKLLSAADFTLGALDTSAAGKKELKIAYQGLETGIEIEVVGVSTMDVITEGFKSETLKGTAYSTSDISVSVTYTDGTTEPVKADSLTFSKIDETTAGEQTLKITYLDKTIEKTIKVCEVTSIRVEGVPVTVQSGKAIDISGMKVYGVYNDKAETEVELKTGITTNIDALNADKNSVEDRKLTVNYTGEYGTFSTEWTIYAAAPELKGITIDSFVEEVLLGGEYTKNNVSVYAQYENGTSVKVTGFEMSEVVTNVAGNVTFTVTYTEGTVTKTATATVKVCTVTAIRVEKNPDSVQASTNAIVPAGMKVVGVYNDKAGSTIELTEGITTNVNEAVDQKKIGAQEFTVTYKGAFGQFSTTASITLTAPALTGIEINKGYATEVLIRGEYNKNSVIATAKYGNDTEKTVYAADLAIEIDTTKAGDATLTVTYGGKTATATVNVCTITKIVIKGVSAHLPAGEELDISKMELWGEYNDTAKTQIQLTAGQITNHNKAEIDANTNENATLTFKVTYTDEVWGELKGSFLISAEEPILDDITIDKYDEEVRKGDTYNKESIFVTAHYGNGTSEDVKGFTVSDIITTAAGEITFTVTYTDGEKTRTATATVKVCEVTSIRVEKNPDSVQASTNAIVPSGMKVVGVYNNQKGEKWTVELTDGITTNVNEVVNQKQIGEQEFTVTYDGAFGQFTTTATITLTAPALTGIEILTYANEVLLNKAYDNSNLSVKATYGNGTTKTVYAADLQFAINTNVAGETTTLTVSYAEGGITKTATASVKVCKITSIHIDGVDKEAQAGKPLDLSAMKVVGQYNDSAKTTVELTSGFVTNAEEIKDTVGKKLLKVTYTDEQGNKVEATHLIYASAPELTGIEIIEWNKTIGIGGIYDTSSIKINAKYGNGATVKVTNFTVSSIDTSKAGQVTFTVTYTEGGVTKTATQTITVHAVTNIAVSGIGQLVVDKGGVHSTSNIQLIVTFGDGSTRVVTKADGVTVADTLDTTSVGDKTLSVSYKGFTATINYTVKDITGIAIFDGIADSLRQGYAVDTSGLVLEITYSDGSKTQKRASELANIVFTGTGINETTFTVKYRDTYTATKTLTLITLDRISGLNKTMPATVLQNSSFSYADVKITAVYSNGEVYMVNDANVKFTPAVFDTTKPGTKGVTIEYFGKTTTVNILVQGVKTVTVVDGSVLKNIKVGQKLDTSKISVLVVYTDGTYIYANINSPFLEIGTIDSSTPGKKTLEVWYQGVKGTTEVNVIEASSAMTGIIFGALLPDEIVARESYKNNFKDNTSAYRVGDDNKYYFYLNLVVLNEFDEIVENVDSKNIPTAATIYLVEGKSERKLEGAERDSYVKFNSTENSYDFTDAAVGKTFRLEILPADEHSYVDAKDVTKSHTVTVVDGYNIYEAWELNIITNGDREITEKCWGDAGARSQLELVTKFLSDRGVTRPANLAGVVLHDNIELRQDDFPELYFANYKNSNGKEEPGMFDQMGLYLIRLTKNQPTFNIYGNYYSIYSYNLPCVATMNQLNNDDEYSSSALIMATPGGGGDNNAYTDIYNKANSGVKNPTSGYVLNVQDIATRDNDPNSNDQSASERHMRGLSCYRVEEITANITNTNVDAFMTSLNIGASNTTVNLNGAKFYNAWQTHVFAWNANYLQRDIGKGTEATLPVFDGIKLYANNSFIAKCGGPVIIAQTPNTTPASSDEYKSYRGTSVDVKLEDNCEIYSYVTGQEAWFVATNQVQLATNIKSMIHPFQVAGKPGFLSTDKIQGVETVNIVMINMGTPEDMNAENYGYNGKFVHGNTVGLLMNSKEQPKYAGQNPALDNYLAATGGKAPIFQSSHDSCYTNPTFKGGAQTAFYDPMSNNGALKDYLLVADADGYGLVKNGDTYVVVNAKGEVVNIDPSTIVDADGSPLFDIAGPAYYSSDAKYLGIHYMGMGIVLEYYH